MNNSVFTGAGVALVTPFTETGVDYQKLDELIEFQIAGGTDAGSYSRTAGGTKITGIALPTRYIHSASCVAAKSDVAATEKLLFAVSDNIKDLL